MTTAVSPLAPSVRTATSATVTYTAPSKPPTSAHQGARPILPRSPRPPCTNAAIASSARVPTRKENVAACTLPTLLPSRELIGACMPTRQPAATPTSTASPRLTLLGVQPCAPVADVDRERRLAPGPHAHHLALDQLACAGGLR